MKRKIIGVVLACFLFLASVANAEKVKLSTLDWEPYIGKNIPDNGFIAEIVLAAFKASGVTEVSTFFLPWEKAVELAKVGNTNGYFPDYYNKDLETDYILSAPMPCAPLVFLKLKTTEFKYTGKVEELKPYKIGVVAGYINTEAIDSATDLTKVEAKDDITNLKNLVSGKIDVAIVDPLVARYYIAGDKLLAPFLEKTETVEPVLDYKQLYIAFSKKSASSEANVKLFGDGLKKIRTDGTLDAILKKHKVEDVVKYPPEK